jgi:hypothetical protein
MLVPSGKMRNAELPVGIDLVNIESRASTEAAAGLLCKRMLPELMRLARIRMVPSCIAVTAGGGRQGRKSSRRPAWRLPEDAGRIAKVETRAALPTSSLQRDSVFRQPDFHFPTPWQESRRRVKLAVAICGDSVSANHAS